MQRLLGLRRQLVRRFSDSPNVSDKVLVSYQNKTCIMTLNSPKAFNALDLDMFTILKSEFDKWDSSKDYPHNLIIKSDHPKAFCAGGNIMDIYKFHKEGKPTEFKMKFFKKEFEIDYRIAELKKKGVSTFAFWDGITMGGGVGLTMGCKHRIATPKTLFAMPEAKIGLFVDVALSYYLSKLQNNMGWFMGVFGHSLKAKEVLFSGLASNYCGPEDLLQLERDIIDSGEPYVLKSEVQSVRTEEVQEGAGWIGLNLVSRYLSNETNLDVRNLPESLAKLDSALQGPQSSEILADWKLFSGVFDPYFDIGRFQFHGY